MIRAAPGGAGAHCDPSGSLAVRGRCRYRCAQVTLDGVVDARTTPWLVSHLVAGCAAADVDVLLLSFARVTYFGAAGLGGLEAVSEAVGRQGVQVVVYDVSPMIRRIIAAGDLPTSIWMLAPEERVAPHVARPVDSR
jgi:anti-anti-sigma factor